MKRDGRLRLDLGVEVVGDLTALVVKHVRDHDLCALANEKAGSGSALSPRFSPKELAAVYLGCQISDEDKKQIAEKIRNNYPDTRILAAEKMECEFALRFRDY